MAKTGPTPTSQTRHAEVQRVPAVALAPVVIAMPQAQAGWMADTKEAYTRYIESTAARVLRDEDVNEVITLFDLIDKRRAYLDSLTGDATDDYKTLVAIRMVDQSINQKSSNLGLGPLARTRLGIARLEEIERTQAAVKAAQEATGGDDF